MNGAETKMTLFIKLSAFAAAALCGGMVLTAAPKEAVRLVGISTQATGKTAAVLIEATEPVAYAVSRPDPLTVFVDLRDVTLGDASHTGAKQGPVSGVTVEKAVGVDGGQVARVRVALSSPSAYRVRSARNVIRLELEPEAKVALTTPAMPAAVTAARRRVLGRDGRGATQIEKIRASHTRTSTTITVAGNGRLNPASLSESDDQPRRLVLDFPNVSSVASARTGVDSVFVKQVRVALNSREPLVTRVVMEIAQNATYHVERTGTDGRDLAIVFEGAKAGAAIMVAPPTPADLTAKVTPAGEHDGEDKLSLAQAIANAAGIAAPDPMTALSAPAAKATAQQSVNPPAAPPAQNPPAAPPAQNPPTAPQPQVYSSDVPGTGQKLYTGHPINFDFEDADLRAVLRVFSAESGLNMIIDPAVQGRVNVLLNDVPWDQALDQILRSNKLGYTVEGNIIRIAPITVLADEQAAAAETGRSQGARR